MDRIGERTERRTGSIYNDRFERFNGVMTTSVHIVHGFAVTGVVFRPLMRRLRRRSCDPTLFRYPSVSLDLESIVTRLLNHLQRDPPAAIIGHSLGSIVTLMAVQRSGWSGPIVLLAPPLHPLPLGRLIPRRMRKPFAPLLDLNAMTSADGYRPPIPEHCEILAIAGRWDGHVPPGCTRDDRLSAHEVVAATHNSLLLSDRVADRCAEWSRR